MKTENRQFDKQGGSALILVVVVTVLLAVVGVMFLMVARASEMETGAVIQSKNLDDAVDTVIARINEVLVEDLFGNNNIIVDNLGGSDEPYDAVRMEDRWLASLEPTWSNDNGTPADPSDDNYVWAQFSRIFSPWGISLPAEICQTSIIPMVADADGDGVTDSGWEQVPGLTTSRGKPVFAAVRIIDNCAMLNLNTANCFDVRSYSDPQKTDPFSEGWAYWDENPVDTFTQLPLHNNQGSGSGRYLTEINYLPFLRGRDLNGVLFDGGVSGESGDGWYNLMIARGFYKNVGGFDYPFDAEISQGIIMDMGNSNYQFFDIGDELELRNRYMVTSKVEARFESEDIANFTLDAGGGTYGALRTPVDDTTAFNSWVIKNNPVNFDAWTGGGEPYRYDRRHVCTFYSYDRIIQSGDYPLLDADLVALSTAFGWTPQQEELAEQIFWPIGPVTTDIAVPVYNTVSGLWENNTNNTETRRRILHLLFAFREYFYDQNGNDLPKAAKSAVQVVANMIDYSDDDAINPTPPDRQGPFHDDGSGGTVDYGAQANVDCTFITENIIRNMIEEISAGLLPVGSYDFGLTETVFGYEKQPFISEVYANRDGSGNLIGFAIELLNPYIEQIDLTRDDNSYSIIEDGWRIKVGDNVINEVITDSVNKDIPGYSIFPASPGDNSHGRYMIYWNASTQVGPLPSNIHEITQLNQMGPALGGNYEIQLLRPAPANSGHSYICVDKISSDEVVRLFGVYNQSAVKRNDEDWSFIYDNWEFQEEDGGTYTHTLGQKNAVTVSTPDSFQIGVADDGLSLTRWHELEVLGLYGNGPASDPNAMTVSSILADAGTTQYYFDLINDSPSILNYVATVNRPGLGTLPGRININTAPMHVIAAAIPPTLADPNAADPTKTVTFSALQLAQAIVDGRPYQKLSDLLTNVSEFGQYDTGGAWEGENVGAQSIEDDIEEEHWILSNLANKFTVRSDVFTAYILVRLGAEGPQRRMIAIFDRSQVWDKNDRPKLVALHPVPDPR